jgi:phosphoribosylaminoimidazole-succinocarboxamide synthase
MGQHDEALTCDQVVDQGLVEPKLWAEVQRVALALFARGQQVAQRAGLILADTKYEFGLDSQGNLLLIDEMHTPDSSRFWDAESFPERFANGLEPISMDKEIIRRALADAGYKGDGPPPQLDESVWLETSKRYTSAYEVLTGEKFVPGERPITERIKRNLQGVMGR